MSESLVAEKNRRARRLALGFAVLVAAGVGAWFALRAHHRKQAWHRAGRAAADVERCMIGEPLAPGEAVPKRLELISASNRPPEAVNPWPQRCLPLFDELEAALHADDLELTAEQDIYYSEMIGPSRSAVQAAATDSGWRWRYSFDLANLHLPPVTSDVALPPPPATPVDPLWVLGDDYVGSIRDRPLVWSVAGACTLAFDAETASCVEGQVGDVPTPSGAALAQLDAKALPKLRLAGRDDDRGVYPIRGGEPVVRATKLGAPIGGVSIGDAFAVLVGGDRVALVHSHGSAVEQTKLTIPADSYPYVVGAYALWHAGDPKHLFVQRIATADGTIGPVLDAGASRSGEDGWLCGTVLADRDVVGVVRGDHWQPLANAPAVTRDVAMTCNGDAAAFVWVDDVVHVVTCTATECRAEQRSARPTPAWKTGRAAVLGDKILLVYHDDEGMWMRLAPLAKLDDARETLLSKAAYVVHDIVSNANTALVIVRYESGVAAIRIDASGKATAINVPR
ncbi:MAG TPA: hypothetical protein VMJ10_28795 [Kofleriaceae bacterium]|nr:hypothetical protein [Kofleriaceae bacterium]